MRCNPIAIMERVQRLVDMALRLRWKMWDFQIVVDRTLQDEVWEVIVGPEKAKKAFRFPVLYPEHIEVLNTIPRAGERMAP